MPPRKTDTEFGGRGGMLPPEEFVQTENLSAAQLAMLDRQQDPEDATATRDTARRKLEQRGNRNDRVGR